VKTVLKSNAGSVFLILILIASLSGNVLLTHRLKVLSVPRLSGVRPERELAAVPAIDDNRTRTLIEFAGSQPTVLYILSPSCEWFKRNQPNIVALASAKRAQYRFIGVSISARDMKTFWETSSLPFPIYVVTSPEYLKDSGFGDLTPQTVLVSSEGKVQKVWLGAYEGKEQEDLERFFGVRLPGLLPASTPQTERQASADGL